MKLIMRYNVLFSLVIIICFFACKKETKIFIISSSTGKDAIISKNVPHSNYGSLDKIHLLSYHSNDSIDNDSRFLLDFDLSLLSKDIKIDSAYIYLYALENDKHFGNNAFIVQRLIGQWEEDKVKWRDQPRPDEKRVVKVDKSSTPDQDYKIEVTKIVRIIVENELNGKGFLFKLQDEKNNKDKKGLKFASGEHSDESKRPRIEIFYKD